MSYGKPIFDYPQERRAPDGEGCPTCGIVLEEDAVLGFCSPECAEYADRCASCQRGQTWCSCETYDEQRMEVTGMVNRETKQVSLVMHKGTVVRDLDLDLADAREVFKALGNCLDQFDN